MQHGAREVEQFSAASTVRLLYCTAKASHHSDALAVLATSERLLAGLPTMQPQLVGKLLWALAVLNLKPRALLDRLPAAMAATGKSLPPSYCVSSKVVRPQSAHCRAHAGSCLIRLNSMQCSSRLGDPDYAWPSSTAELIEELSMPAKIQLA